MSLEAIHRLKQQIDTLRMDNAVLSAANRKLSLSNVQRRRVKLYYYLCGVVHGAGVLALIEFLYHH